MKCVPRGKLSSDECSACLPPPAMCLVCSNQRTQLISPVSSSFTSSATSCGCHLVTTTGERTNAPRLQTTREPATTVHAPCRAPCNTTHNLSVVVCAVPIRGHCPRIGKNHVTASPGNFQPPSCVTASTPAPIITRFVAIPALTLRNYTRILLPVLQLLVW